MPEGKQLTPADGTTSAENEFDHMLDNVPPDLKQMVISSFQMSAMSPQAEVMKKINEEHITEFLSASREQMQNDYKDRKHQRIMAIVAALILAVVAIVVILLLRDEPDSMEKVLYTILGGIAGAFGGYGFGKSKSRE